MECCGNLHRLVACALLMLAADVDGVVLVGQPVQEAVAEIVLGDEGRPETAEDDDVEPAEMVGEEQSVRPRPLANQG